MNRIIGLRRAGRVLAGRLAPSACVGGAGALILNHSAQRVRFDSLPPVSASQEPQHRPLSNKLSPKAVKQISSGSITGPSNLPAREFMSMAQTDSITDTSLGLGAGLVVALFSRTLVFLGGLLAFSSYVRRPRPARGQLSIASPADVCPSLRLDMGLIYPKCLASTGSSRSPPSGKRVPAVHGSQSRLP